MTAPAPRASKDPTCDTWPVVMRPPAPVSRPAVKVVDAVPEKSAELAVTVRVRVNVRFDPVVAPVVVSNVDVVWMVVVVCTLRVEF